MDTEKKAVRVLGLLTGEVKSPDNAAFVKYGELFASLAKSCQLVDVFDVELRGFRRYQNAVRTIRLSKYEWQKALHMNLWAAEKRAKKSGKIVRRFSGEIDVIFQHGANFFVPAEAATVSVVIYEDFTFALTRRENPWNISFKTEADKDRWQAMQKEAYHQAAFVLTRSAYTRNSIIQDYSVPPERVAVVGGGINFTPLPDIFHHPENDRILFIGKDFDRKGGAQLVKAFHEVKKTVRNAELFLVTDETGVTGPGIYRVKPTYDRSVIRQLYREAAVYVMPSHVETWGDVFLEAMAFGLPCIGSNRDAMPEIIEHGKTGYVVDPDNSSALADYLIQLLTQPELRAKMGTLGRERVERHFTWDSVVARMLPFIESAAKDA